MEEDKRYTSTHAIDQFLSCPRKAYLKSREMISLDAYYRYVKQTMLLTGIQWTMIYRYNEGPKPKLYNLMVEHRDRAWLARPSNVQTAVQGGPSIKFYREKLLKDTTHLSEFIRTKLRGSGSFVGTSVRYDLKGGIHGRLDAVSFVQNDTRHRTR